VLRVTPKRYSVVGAICAVIAVIAMVAPATASARTDSVTRWNPSLTSTMDWQYSGRRNLNAPVSIFNLDGEETSRTIIRAVKSDGKRAVCYFSAGSYESYRADRTRFPKKLLGRTMDGWPDERWLDIRAVATLRPIMRERMRTCKAKGFDGVDPDNVAGFTNRTGFPLTARHQVTYNKMIASEAHKLGLAVGLKNDPSQARQLAPYFDFAVTEQCFQYDECQRYLAFIWAGKPVMNIEYKRTPSVFCEHTTGLGIFSVQKRVRLDSWRRTCS
jgi:hypothetical protein